MENNYGIGVNNRYAMLLGNEEEGDTLERKMLEKTQTSPKTAKKKVARPEKDGKIASKKEISEVSDAPKVKESVTNTNGIGHGKGRDTDAPKLDTRERDGNRNEKNGDFGRGSGSRAGGYRQGQENAVSVGRSGMNEKRDYGKSREMACFQCGELDHIARDCPTRAEKNAAREQERQVEMICYGCNEAGHIARDCPNKEQRQTTTRANNMECYECRETGHLARDCEVRANRSQRGGNNRGMENSNCYKCGELGHFARECIGTISAVPPAEFIPEDAEDVRSDFANVDQSDDQSNLIADDNVEIAQNINVTQAKESNDTKEQEEVTYTFDEWKATQGEKKEQQFNTRKAGEGASNMDPKWKKTYAYKKEKDALEKEEEDDELEHYPQRIDRQKFVDISISFTDKTRTGPDARGNRGNERGGKDGRGERRWGKELRGSKDQAPNILDNAAFPSL